MSKRITKEEPETLILFNEAEPTARITTFNGKLKRKLAKVAEQRPDLCVLMSVDDYGGETWELPRRLLQVNPKVPMSAEKRAELSERAKSRGLGRQGSDQA